MSDARLSDDVIARLAAAGAATVHEAQGGTRAMDGGIKPLASDMVVVGSALTVSTVPADNLAIHHAMTMARPGDVLVVDAGGHLEAGIWGDVLTEAAQVTGLAGVIVDGAVRDSQTIVGSGFPCFARGLSIKGSGKWVPGSINEAITCGGVVVRPGDIVVGDADGVVLFDRTLVFDVVELAEARATKERILRDRVREGHTLLDLMDLRQRLQVLDTREMNESTNHSPRVRKDQG